MNEPVDTIPVSYRRWLWLAVVLIAVAFFTTTALVVRSAQQPVAVVIESCAPAYLREMDIVGSSSGGLPAFSTDLDAISTQLAPADTRHSSACAVQGAP